jgi:hypothetical protein
MTSFQKVLNGGVHEIELNRRLGVNLTTYCFLFGYCVAEIFLLYGFGRNRN